MDIVDHNSVINWTKLDTEMIIAAQMFLHQVRVLNIVQNIVGNVENLKHDNFCNWHQMIDVAINISENVKFIQIFCCGIS